MKVLHLIGGGDTGGARTLVISLLAGLGVRPDVSVRMVSFREGEFADASRAAGIDVRVVQTGSPLKDLRLLLREVREGGWDVVHSHGAKANTYAYLLKRLTGIPTLTTLHSDYRSDYLHSRLKQLTLGSLNTFAIRRLDFQAGVAGRMARLLIARGFDPQRVFHFYNGLDFSSPPAAMDSAARRAFFAQYDFLVADGDIVVGAVARIEPIKDLSTLLRAFAQARKSCPALKLAFAGDGLQRPELARLAAELGVEKHVVFAGWMEETEPFYRAIDINALTSLSEGFPYSLLEGIRCRRCTVATAVGGIPEMIDDGVNGYLVRPRDVDTLAEHLAVLARDPSLMRRFGDQLFEKASQLFSLDATLDEHERIYRHIMGWAEAKKQKKRRVLICGAYGFGNAGDDGILQAILGDIRSISPYAEIRVMSRNPKNTRLTQRVGAFHTFNVLAFAFHALRGTLYLNGGGTLITDVTSRRSLLFYLGTITAAKRLGCSVLLYGCGIGPVSHARARRRAAAVLERHADALVLREERAREELARWGVTGPAISVTADPAVGLPPASAAAVAAALVRSGIPADKKLLGVAVRRWARHEDTVRIIADALNRFRESHGFMPVFIPMQPDDAAVSADIASRLREPACQLAGNCSVEEIIGVVGQMDAVLGMRLHALIFAASQRVPALGIAYDVKVSCFMRSLAPCYELCPEPGGPLCLPLESLQADALHEALAALVAAREKQDALSGVIAAHLTQNAARSRGIMQGFLEK